MHVNKIVTLLWDYTTIHVWRSFELLSAQSQACCSYGSLQSGAPPSVLFSWTVFVALQSGGIRATSYCCCSCYCLSPIFLAFATFYAMFLRATFSLHSFFATSERVLIGEYPLLCCVREWDDIVSHVFLSHILVYEYCTWTLTLSWYVHEVDRDICCICPYSIIWDLKLHIELETLKIRSPECRFAD